MTRLSRILFTFSLLSVLFMPVSFAAIDCSQNFIEESTERTPLSAILCPASRVLNIAIAASSVIFALYVIYSGVKLSLAQGDPKGFDAAKWSLTYAVIGFGIIMAFFVIIRIVLNLLGVEDFGEAGSILPQVESNIDVFKRFFGRCPDPSNPYCP